MGLWRCKICNTAAIGITGAAYHLKKFHNIDVMATENKKRKTKNKKIPDRDHFRLNSRIMKREKEVCRECGIEFGKDGRAFEYEKGKKPLCYVCKIKKMTKKQLQELAKIILKKND